MSSKGSTPLVPRLRFPEFQHSGEWATEKLGSLVSISTEKVGNSDCVPMSITSGVGLVSQEDKFGRVIAGDSYKNYLLLKPFDFAYNKSATKEYPEGFLALYTEDKLAAVPNSIFTCFRVVGISTNLKYLNYLFLGNLHGKWLRNFIQVGARANGALSINDSDLLTLPIPLPSGNSSHKEQQKIADCLSSLDELITAQARKVDALKTHKKGLMQQLFPCEGETQPRLRFPEFRGTGEWNADSLGVVADFVNEKIALERVALENYVSTVNILADFGGIYKASKLPTTDFVTRFQLNDTLVSNIRPYLKKVWVADKEGGASNDVIVIRAKQKLLPKYLSVLLKNDAFIDYVMTGAKGVKMPRGDIDSMKVYPALYPSKSEQQRIADCLSSVDTLITAATQTLATYRAHKKGLMQQLFPSMEGIGE